MEIIRIELLDPPAKGADPLGDLLQDTAVSSALKNISLEVHRKGTMTIDFRCRDGDAALQLSTLLAEHRKRYGFISGIVMPEATNVPPSDLPPDTVVALGEVL